MILSKEELKALKAKAHALHPIVTVGNKGLTESVLDEIGIALKSHEVLKLKIAAGEKEERLAMAETICKAHRATLIQSIGHTVSIYRPKPIEAATEAKKAKHAKKRIKPGYRARLHDSRMKAASKNKNKKSPKKKAR
jgi:RNA-binding protein